jgi:hypothetical protein
MLLPSCPALLAIALTAALENLDSFIDASNRRHDR